MTKEKIEAPIFDDSIWLERELFYFEEQKQKSAPPTANLNPASALDGAKFESSTSPSAQPKKKTLVVDSESLANAYGNSALGVGEQFAILKRLQIAGFKIFLCTKSGQQGETIFLKLDEDPKNFKPAKELSKFNPEKDYEALAKNGVAREQSLILKRRGIFYNNLAINNNPEMMAYIFIARYPTLHLNLINDKKLYNPLSKDFLKKMRELKPTELVLGGTLSVENNFENLAQEIFSGNLFEISSIGFHYDIRIKESEEHLEIPHMTLKSLENFKTSLESENLTDQEKKNLNNFKNSIRFISFNSDLNEQSKSLLKEVFPNASIETPQASQTQIPTKPGQIRIAQDNFAKSLNVEDSDKTPTSQMALAGEVLNAALENPQIRTCVIKGDILQNLNQEEYLPKTFNAVEGLKALDETAVEKLKNQNFSEDVYYKFSQKITANKRFRLPSADAAQELVGIVGDSNFLKIEKGDDDFFYATSKVDRELRTL